MGGLPQYRPLKIYLDVIDQHSQGYYRDKIKSMK